MLNLSALRALFFISLTTQLFAMEVTNEVANQILLSNFFKSNYISCLKPNAELSFIQPRSIGHDLHIYDFLEEEGKSFLQYLTSDKLKNYLERFKDTTEHGRTFCTDFNIGCGKESSGYYAILNSCMIIKAIFEKDKQTYKEHIKSIWDLKKPSDLFWSSLFNHRIIEEQRDGEWRKLILNLRKDDAIVKWYAASLNDKTGTNINIETAKNIFFKIEDEHKKNNLSFNLPGKSDTERLSRDEIITILSNLERSGFFNNKFNLSNFSIVDVDLLKQDQDYWDNNIYPILNSFKESKNSKTHAFILSEYDGLWYALILNKTDKHLQYIYLDSSNKYPIDKVLLKDIFRFLKHDQFTKIFSNASGQLEMQKINTVTSTSEIKNNDVNDTPILPSKTLTKKDYAGELPFEMRKLIYSLNNLGTYTNDFKQKYRNTLLLYGPPGTGKSTIAKIIAGETNGLLFAKNGGTFINKYQGSGSDSWKN